MLEKIELIIIFSIIALGLLLLWNNLSLERLIKMSKKGESQLPDDKYFELKYKNQYFSFAAVLLLAFVGALGYSSFQDIENELKQNLDKISTEYNTKLDEMANSHNHLVDSLITNRIDKTNNEIKSVNSEISNELNKAYNELYKDVSSAREEINSYNKKLKEIYERFGYSDMISVQEISLMNNDKPIKLISFKNLGINNLKNIPAVFISQKNSFDYKIINVTRENIEIEVSNAKQDTIRMSLMLFVR